MHEHSTASAATAPTPSTDSHGGTRLGPFLCWAVVFADIGTSVYYTPGILFGQVGIHAALFVAMTTVVFILLALKYIEVTVRYPEGGGVVTVGTRAIHPFVGLIGGMFILVDYFLTAALSAVSGIAYLATVFPGLNGNLIQGLVAIIALLILGLLNWYGISESAKVSAIIATIAFLSQALVLLVVIFSQGIPTLLDTFPKVFSGPRMGPFAVLSGYAGAFLAFSGLESISQLSPVMAKPRLRVSRIAMGAVVGTVGLTSPLLTLWSTTVLDHKTVALPANSNALISILGSHVGGTLLGLEVAISGSILLIFACNTAIIGSYHVFLALSRMRFFPEFIEQRNKLRNTPHWAIVLAVGIPVLILIPASLSADTQLILGDLYAFGLLGAFSVTCLSLDVVRWRERQAAAQAGSIDLHPHHGEHEYDEHGHRRMLTGRVTFVIGVITTLCVVVAWGTNLINKPLATLFGGSVSTLGLIVAVVNYRRQERQGTLPTFPIEMKSIAVQNEYRDSVLVVLTENNHIEDLVRTAAATAHGRRILFAYQGQYVPTQRPRIFEVVDPFHNDRAAQAVFSHADRIARRLKLKRDFVYVTGNPKSGGIHRVWQTARPRDAIVAAGQEGLLQDFAPDRVRRAVGASGPIIHYVKHWSPATTESEQEEQS